MAKALNIIKNYIYTIKQLLDPFKSKYLSPSSKKNVIKWFKDDGDATLRQEYELNDSSVVFDIGGYKGQWASDIFSRYLCKIYIFEPVSDYANNIKKRFHNCKNISVYNFGLAEQTTTIPISIHQDGSSIFIDDNSPKEIIQLRKASDFIKENSISHIDLMKINIEGGEYGLLENLIESKLIQNIDNIQVQFHEFFPDAEKRMKRIQKELSKTHYLTYQYEFVWENWRIHGK